MVTKTGWVPGSNELWRSGNTSEALVLLDLSLRLAVHPGHLAWSLKWHVFDTSVSNSLEGLLGTFCDCCLNLSWSKREGEKATLGHGEVRRIGTRENQLNVPFLLLEWMSCLTLTAREAKNFLASALEIRSAGTYSDMAAEFTLWWVATWMTNMPSPQCTVGDGPSGGHSNCNTTF